MVACRGFCKNIGVLHISACKLSMHAIDFELKTTTFTVYILRNNFAITPTRLCARKPTRTNTHTYAGEGEWGNARSSAREHDQSKIKGTNLVLEAVICRSFTMLDGCLPRFLLKNRRFEHIGLQNIHVCERLRTDNNVFHSLYP